MNKIGKRLTFAAFALVSFLGLASCGKEKETQDPNSYDAITKQCTLNVAYEGKNFVNDGIGEATLSKATDGDTATFLLVEGGDTVTIRFFGIDTPESTGAVEKWGKSASKFTESKLTSAKGIVLEASTTPASHDSYGTRYLGYVWYRTTDNGPWYNLNLQVVENGYSVNKCQNTAEYKYYQLFKKAEDFAKAQPLHIWDKDAEDPYYNAGAQVVTLKELNENIDSYYDSETSTGSKVRVTACIKDVYVSSTQTYTFTAVQIIDGKEYTFNIYAGYSSAGISSYLQIGSEYRMTGSVQKYNDKYQISGLTYVPLKKGGDYLTLISEDCYLQFSNDITYTAQYGASLYGNVKVSNAKVEGTTLTFTGTATNAKTKQEETLSFTCPVAEGFTASTIEGKSIKTFGRVENGVVSIINYSNITM